MNNETLDFNSSKSLARILESILVVDIDFENAGLIKSMPVRSFAQMYSVTFAEPICSESHEVYVEQLLSLNHT